MDDADDGDGPDGVMDEILHGGVANAGSVLRRGRHVLRPSNAHSATIHAMLRHIADSGFEIASQPVGIDPDGRERLIFVEGDVAVPPYPAWVRSDEALASITLLLRRFHEAVRSWTPPSTATWSDEMIDPVGAARGLGDGLVVCHNDVCLENVVFRDGKAVALLDFDFAAPGRPLFDLVQFARMCIPVDDEINSSRLGWESPDVFTRLRLVADTYGLAADDRSEFLTMLSASIERGGQFVQRRVLAGDPNFVAMWNEMGGMERFDRRRRWFFDNHDRFVEALR